MRQRYNTINYPVIVIIFIIILLSNSIVMGGDIAKKIYKVDISQDIIGEPHAMSAWRVYGDAKLKWRTVKFFEHFPDENEYRYTYKEELDCRKQLADYWVRYKKRYPNITNEYLDELAMASKSLFFPEYVYYYFKDSDWEIEKNRFRLDDFKRWKKEYIKHHDAKTLAEVEEIDL